MISMQMMWRTCHVMSCVNGILFDDVDVSDCISTRASIPHEYRSDLYAHSTGTYMHSAMILNANSTSHMRDRLVCSVYSISIVTSSITSAGVSFFAGAFFADVATAVAVAGLVRAVPTPPRNADPPKMGRLDGDADPDPDADAAAGGMAIVALPLLVLMCRRPYTITPSYTYHGLISIIIITIEQRYTATMVCATMNGMGERNGYHLPIIQ